MRSRVRQSVIRKSKEKKRKRKGKEREKGRAANIYTTDTIARIDPATGEVRSLLDCSGLLKLYDRRLSTDVLNGIAYNPDEDAVYLTGKYWPKLFKIKKIW